jgi:hypothetical protein
MIIGFLIKKERSCVNIMRIVTHINCTTHSKLSISGKILIKTDVSACISYIFLMLYCALRYLSCDSLLILFVSCILRIYGWIGTLLYRFKKKIDEKKFSILEVISSASYCTMWQENMNKFSRLPHEVWLWYTKIIKNPWKTHEYDFFSYATQTFQFFWTC